MDASLPSRDDSSLYSKEKAKYEKIWELDAYRQHSPGEQIVNDAIRALGIEKGERIADFGCGSGRAAQKFFDAGYQVLAIDIAQNCRDHDMTATFMNACLWELPDLELVDYGFCTDVMEHIPPEKVDDTLASIKKVTSGDVFFQIFTKRDGFGARIGEVLHLTVQPSSWWLEKLSEYWKPELLTENANRFTVICRA